MAASFNASESGYSWMASSYLLANASCIPLWGKVSDIWGRKYMILLANFIFLIASLICALSVNLAMMLAGRALQGIGGGGIVVLTNISVSDLFSVRLVLLSSKGLSRAMLTRCRQRPMYYGLFGAIWAVAGALGPIIGGAFTTSVTWRWCFYLNRRFLNCQAPTSIANQFKCLSAVSPCSPSSSSSRWNPPKHQSWLAYDASTGQVCCSWLAARSCFSSASNSVASTIPGPHPQ